VRPLTLNLLVEEIEAEQANARDPVRVAILGAVLILGAAVGYGSWVMMRAGDKKEQAASLQKKWTELNSKQAGATVRALRTCADEFSALHTQRTLFGPEIAKIKDVIPDSVLLSRIGLRLNLEAVTIAPPPAAAGKKPGLPRTKNVQSLMLRLEGGAIGTRPEIEVDRFLGTLRTSPVLSNQIKEVNLRSIARTGSESGAATLKAQFSIDCRYKEAK